MDVNVITLAYLGDAVYELYIREYLFNNGYIYVDDMQKDGINYVSAKAQANILTNLMDNNILSEEEIDIVKRGRNNKRKIKPKNTDIITYKLSTGFEALIGYLYLNNKERLEIIMSEVLK